MSAVAQHRFTRRQYHRMAETGVLESGARVELLNGQIIDMSPIGPFHGGVVKRLIRLFSNLSRGRWLMSAQDPTELDDYSEPQPDIMLLKPSADDYTTRHPEPADIFLLIEVSDSSLDRDRGEKLEAYARAGISEVWIVNLCDERVEVYREPLSGKYGQTLVAEPGGSTGGQLRPLAFPDAVVDVASLLARGGSV